MEDKGMLKNLVVRRRRKEVGRRVVRQIDF